LGARGTFGLTRWLDQQIGIWGMVWHARDGAENPSAIAAMDFISTKLRPAYHSAAVLARFPDFYV
jgi:hypothetical protein